MMKSIFYVMAWDFYMFSLKNYVMKRRNYVIIRFWLKIRRDT
jgi:hypothetical protein